MGRVAMSDRFCEYCNGSGTVQLMDSLVMCRNCNGTGVIKANPSVFVSNLLGQATMRSETRVVQFVEELKQAKELQKEVEALKAEVDRLKRGDFTPEEFQNLCHNKDEKNECAFKNGCIEYWTKLGFSTALPNDMLVDYSPLEMELAKHYMLACDWCEGMGSVEGVYCHFCNGLGVKR